MTLSTFSCISRPFMCILWWNVYSSICPFLKFGCLSSYSWFIRVIHIFCIQSFVKYISCKYFLPVYGFFSMISMVYLEETKVFVLRESNSSIFILWLKLLVSYLRNLCLIQGQKDLLQCFLLKFPSMSPFSA